VSSNEIAAKAPMVSVLLVNYNTAHLTCRCLESLIEHCGFTPFEIILVDNNSTDESLPILRPRFPSVTILANSSNVGFGNAINQSATLARGRYLFLLNTDTELREDTIGCLRQFLDEHPDAGAAGCRLLSPDGSPQPGAAYFPSMLRVAAGREVTAGLLRRHFPNLAAKVTFFLPDEDLNRPRKVDWCVAAALMVRREAFSSIGGFDPRIFLYGEEMDLCLRLIAAGWSIYYDPETAVVHLGAASSGDDLNPRRLAYIAAGHRYFYHKHYGIVKGKLFCLIEVAAAVLKATIWSMAGMAGNTFYRSKYFGKARWHINYLKNYLTYNY
jgi:GT2 family glycosyltransferase